MEKTGKTNLAQQVKNASEFMEGLRTGKIDGHDVKYIPGTLYSHPHEKPDDFSGAYCTVGFADKLLQSNFAKTCKEGKDRLLANYDYSSLQREMGVKDSDPLVQYNDGSARTVHEKNKKDHAKTWKAIYNNTLQIVDSVFVADVAKEIKKRFKHEP